MPPSCEERGCGEWVNSSRTPWLSNGAERAVRSCSVAWQIARISRVLLPVPAGTHYFPPRVLEGRLLSRRAMGLRLRPVVSLMQARGSGEADHLLVVGSRPAEHKTDLILLLLLTSLGLLASVRFALLALPARSATAAS